MVAEKRAGSSGSGQTLPPGLLHRGIRGHGEIREHFGAVSPAGLQAPSHALPGSPRSPPNILGIEQHASLHSFL